MQLQPYACDPLKSRGRLIKEDQNDSRSFFERDRDRILHSSAFRRLAYKTQVFVNYQGDHYRTRLTHSLEVAQIARRISRELGLSEDLTETLALAHDLGHPPFGHAGERYLNNMLKDYGGFDHNVHTIKLITGLESYYAEFDGLNLSWETLEGIAKHNGPLIGPYSNKQALSSFLAEYNKKHNLELDKFPSLEAQIASLADDIAYNNHDLEDGIRAGLINIDDLADLPLISDIWLEVIKKYPNIEQKRLVREAIRRSIKVMIEDLVDQTKKNISCYNIDSVEKIREHDRFVAAFSETMQDANTKLKKFLFSKVYRHPDVNKMTFHAETIITFLFNSFFNHPNCLPPKLWHIVENCDDYHKATVIADYIAGMTDRFASKQYNAFVDINASF